ncbi:hypothetical protein GGR56DRAFT_634457 [Xylariaceae sp. FL0804]|nr:hypothetical protein GGR56DRAFT_634457 [Xylariaceae sp. FL0804]
MMHRALSSRWLNNAFGNVVEPLPRLELPLYLCPFTSTHRAVAAPVARPLPWRALPTRRRCLHMQAADASTTIAPATPTPATFPPVSNHDVLASANRRLPQQCSGCGALSQTLQPNQPGYFDLDRKAVRKYLGVDSNEAEARRTRDEEKVFEDALRNVDHKSLEEHGIDAQAFTTVPTAGPTTSQPAPKKPLCDRCHFLLHNHTGRSIFHPTLDSIHDTILESPYKYNHVYHVLDAADFPMSILPAISQLLGHMPLRSRNRRSRAGKFYHGQKIELSFIITRSDLLAPTKAQVDTLFPYLREVLRDALGRSGRDVRLGNLRAVSAKRSWWTKELKDDIWKRGGAGWMIGKANVGKSQLFEAVFPKGRMESTPTSHQISVNMQASPGAEVAEVAEAAAQSEADSGALDDGLEELDDDFSLLPPAPEETQYPEMPLVSDLPGTTASPIRVPFGNKRGELIDMPGLERTGLEHHVQEEHRLSLIMKSRISPKQMTLRPNQSLLVGGLIRITPREPAPIMLTYAFTPIQAHVTNTDKAIAIQEQTGEVNIENIAVPGTGQKTKLAGSFALKTDVTKYRTGPLTRKDGIGLRVERLPYRVLSTDILIEGVGWVEIVAQVRTKDLFGQKIAQADDGNDGKSAEQTMSALERLEAVAGGPPKSRPAPIEPKPDDELNWPMVDVYSPQGKFIADRRSMNAWMLNKPKISAESRKSRPRKSMRGVKKLEKQRAREARAASF